MIEYPLIGFALMIAGVMLAPWHVAWSILLVFGVLWLLFPTAANWFNAWRAARAIGARLEALKSGGFSADVVLKGAFSVVEGRAAFDFSAGKIACLWPDRTAVLPLSAIKSVTIGSWHALGASTPSWYSVDFSFGGDAGQRPEPLSVAFGSRHQAQRSIEALRRRLPDTVEIAVESPRGMNAQSADALIILAVILNVLALAVISPTGWFALAVLAALAAAVPTAFARGYRRAVGIVVLALSVASAIRAYPAHDRSMTLYQKSAKERAAEPRPAVPSPAHKP